MGACSSSDGTTTDPSTAPAKKQIEEQKVISPQQKETPTPSAPDLSPTPTTDVGDGRKTLEESTADTEALWKTHRAAVELHAKKMKEYFEQASKAHSENDGAKAKQLSTLGKEEQKLMHEAQRKAANAIFLGKNPDPHSGTIDLHGLQVDEAVLIVEEHLNYAQNHRFPQLRIITGAGHHSTPRGPAVKPAIQKLLKEKEYNWTEDSDNRSGGSLTVTF